MPTECQGAIKQYAFFAALFPEDITEAQYETNYAAPTQNGQTIILFVDNCSRRALPTKYKQYAAETWESDPPASEAANGQTTPMVKVGRLSGKLCKLQGGINLEVDFAEIEAPLLSSHELKRQVGIIHRATKGHLIIQKG